MSRDMTAQTKLNDSGPNYLGYYKRMVLDLLSQSDDFLSPFSGLDPGSSGTCTEGKDKGLQHLSLFHGGIVDGISDFKRERLKGFLHQTVVELNQETDKILGHILAKFHIEADLRDKGVYSCYPSTTYEDFGKCCCNEKQKPSSCPLHPHLDGDATDPKSHSFSQVYHEVQQLIERGLQPKEALDKFSNDTSAKLGQMEQSLEEFLDAVMSKCRAMTTAEKQQLGQRIHKLPVQALDRVVEIISRKSPGKSPTDKIINVNLEEEDDVMLWRLYTYVETVAIANKRSKQRSVG